MERNQVQAKVIQVNQELCAGCGSCIDACSAGAIHLVDHVAEIDVDLCTACEACLESCPNGAIIAITSPSDSIFQPSSDPGLNLVQQLKVLPEREVPVRGFKPLAGAALAFLGNEVAPRLVSVLIKSIENRLAQPTATSISRSIPSSQEYGLQYGGQRKQIRYRGGQMGNKKYKGRR